MQRKSDQFAENGFVLVDNVFDENSIAVAFDIGTRNFNDALVLIKEKELPFGLGIKNGFKEIVQRHPNRYEMPFRMDLPEFDFVLQSHELRNVVAEILQCDDFVVANRSLVVSEPGCLDQGWHSDGPHVNVEKHLSCHVLNVFIPLVDVDLCNGPTEFRPASHYFTRGDLTKALLLAKVKKTLRPVECPTIKRGSVLLFDYRVLHRGTANRSDYNRPILVFTFAKPWYKDLLNFPHRSLFDITGPGELKSDTDDNKCIVI